MKPELHERKWEINSLLFVIRLCHGFWQKTGDLTIFDERWAEAMRLLLRTLREQQRKENDGPYHFQRLTLDPADAVANRGYGQPTRKNGMIHGIFRQDDATIFPLHVPDNIMAVTELRKLAELWQATGRDATFADDCRALAAEVERAVREDAIVEHKVFGPIFAFEIDGFGSRLCMDDPSLPGLLNLPVMGYWNASDPVWQNTRRFVLSDWNPMHEEGSTGDGFGSPHFPKGRIWPMGTVSRAFTAASDEEIRLCLDQLVRNHLHTGFIHETYDKNNAMDFTRHWFAWVNSWFAELILWLAREKPALLR